MINDGYPVEDNSWKCVPGAQAGALILDYKLSSKPRYWACHCLACGNPYTEKREDNLKLGAIGGKINSSGRMCKGSRSCGCKQKNSFVNANTKGLIIEDLSGQILNNWKVIEKTNFIDSNRSYYYIVQSNIYPEFYDIISGRHLKDGRCARADLAKKTYCDLQFPLVHPKGRLSKFEQKMLEMLQSLNLHSETQVRFDNCKDKIPLPFDFMVLKNNQKWIIEIDGEQHFLPIESWGGEDKLRMQRAHDLIKNRFCFNNNIPLIRIPTNMSYTELDIIPETSRFILTKENEQDYYNRGWKI